MARKAISSLAGKVKNCQVHLTWYKSTSFFDNTLEHQNEFSFFNIYRKECNDFEFNNDYAEFFDGIIPGEDDLIFEGELFCTNNRKYEYIDSQVEVGKTYAYFVKSNSMPCVGPAPLKVRDPNKWWSYDKLCQKLNDLKQEYPELIEISTCGKTVSGCNIPGIKIGSGKPFIGLMGALHPGEAGPELLISALEVSLKNNPQLLKEKSIVAIPSVNIDARQQLVQGIPWYLRKNRAGVDLNRNFPAEWEVVAKNYGFSTRDKESMTYRGPSPGSEPETKAVMAFFEANTPQCIFSFHALAGICDLPGLAAGGKAAEDKDYCKIAESFIFAYGNGLHPEWEPDCSWWSNSCTEGSFVRWAYQALGIPAFDLELTDKIDPEKRSLCIHDQSGLELLDEYITRHSRAIESVMKISI